MNAELTSTIAFLEQEIESHHQSVAELESALIPLRKLAGGTPSTREKTGSEKRQTDRARTGPSGSAEPP